MVGQSLKTLVTLSFISSASLAASEDEPPFARKNHFLDDERYESFADEVSRIKANKPGRARIEALERVVVEARAFIKMVPEQTLVFHRQMNALFRAIRDLETFVYQPK